MLNMCNFPTRMKQGSVGKAPFIPGSKGNCSIIHAQSSILGLLCFFDRHMESFAAQRCVIFSNKFLNLRLCHLCFSQAMETFASFHSNDASTARSTMFLKWETPLVDWFNSIPMVPLKEFEIVCVRIKHTHTHTEKYPNLILCSTLCNAIQESYLQDWDKLKLRSIQAGNQN